MGGERRERQREGAHKRAPDSGGVMEQGGNGHKRVWQIKASPFVLLLCRERRTLSAEPGVWLSNSFSSRKGC